MTNSGWKLKRITAPAVEPLTLQEAKDHLRVIIDDDDAYIESLIAAARESAELYTRRAFVAQVWEAGFEIFPACGVIELAKPPLITVQSVKYTDDEGVVQTLDASAYEVDDYSEPARIVRLPSATWPALSRGGIRVRVRFMAGYAQGEGSPSDDAENVPEAIKQAMRVHVAEMYENRQVSREMPQACESLLHPFRVYGWGDA